MSYAVEIHFLFYRKDHKCNFNHKGHKECTKDTELCEPCETFVSFVVKKLKVAHCVTSEVVQTSEIRMFSYGSGTMVYAHG